MRWLHFIFSHSIFISLCAVALCYQTFQLLHIPTDGLICRLVFFATLSSYNFYWLLSKYRFSNITGLFEFLMMNITNLLILLIAGSALIYFLFFLPAIIPAVFVAVLLTLLYSIPLWPVDKLSVTKHTGFLKTVLLAFTWTYVTVMIPVQQAFFISNLPVLLIFISRFFFMLMLCIIFDSRDVNIDMIRSLSSLATDVSRKSLQVIMAAVFIFYLATVLLLRYYFTGNTQLFALCITGLLTIYVYRLSQKKKGYFFYYFLVDGLMLFSAAATYVASI